MPIKTASKNKDFVSIPRDLYEEFLIWEKTKNVKIVKPTKSELRAIARGRKNFAQGKYTSWEKVKHELANSRNQSRKEGN